VISPRRSPKLLHSARRHLGGIRTLSRIAFAMMLVIAVVLSVGAQNQNKKGEAELRTIHGSAIDKSDNPVPSTVIYLLNVKTQDVKTYIADEAGAYRFSGLDPNVDYEVHAEHNDLMSATRTVSSFDSRRDIEVILKLSHQKPAK
jgi:hypothetical protein